MLCFRCGSHVQDGAEKCWNCGTVLSSAQTRRGATAEQRAQQRTGSRVFGVVFKIGDLIANRYKVKDIVGSGGAGVVYRAHDTEIDVDVAVKVINAKLVQTSDEQRLFSRQTKIARKLSHQNVVRIYDEGRDETRPYVTMQFLEGLSLRKIIDLRNEKKQTFTLAEVEPIFNQLCQALDYAHKTTFHGNLKPDNVIVLPDLLKITDFALLRGLPRKPFLAIQKSRGSNFRYLAPEVRLEVADLERSVDVYSLGVVLAEMLTGVVYDDGKPEKLTASGLEPAILAVIQRCVARAPKDRYASTQDLYADLRSALSRGSGAKAAAAAAAAGDAPTQRLEMDKHGKRPVTADVGKRPPPEVPPAPPAPVEIQPSLAVASAVESPAEVGGKREGTDLHDFEVDDDMIESSIVAQKKQANGARPPENGVPANGANGHAGHAEPAPMAAAPEPDLVDNPHAVELPEDEEETIAVFDHPPMPSRPIAAEGISVRPEPGLEEISNSAIELIADPSATNVYDVDAKGEPRPSVQVKDVATHNRTIQPTPLPDSAIPSPAFSQVAHEDTRHGRLDGGEDAPVAPDVVVRGDKADKPDEPTQGITYAPKPQTRGPTAAYDGSAAPKAKKRPMTRPRMPTMAAAPVPMTSTVGGPAIVDPSTMPRPATQEALSIPSMVAPQALAPPPPPADSGRNRGVLITVVLSLFAVLLAVVIVVVVLTKQSNLEEKIAMMQAEAQQARATGTAARADAKKAGEEAAVAARAEAAAKEREEAAEAEKKAAEAAALAKEAEARRLEEEAKKSADAEKKKEAERRAKEAAEAAAERRAAAREADAERREERKKAAEERKRREEREREQRDKERLAKEQDEAARRAEDRAKRLAAAEAEDEARARRDQAKAEEERRRREAEEAAKAREDERKRKEAEAAAKKAEEKKEDPTPAAMVAPDKEQECPRGMVLVKASTFMLGSKRNDPERNFGDKDYVSIDVPAFCIDYYEYPNGRGRSPSTKVSFKTAAARCKKRKKRLCSEEEWEKACKGPSGSRYPYANQWDPSSCNTEDDEGADRQVEKSGSFRKCRSGYNVFDMSGNVAEWTSTQWGSGYVVKGGASDRPGYDGRCAARKKKKDGSSSETLGFRCCADPG